MKCPCCKQEIIETEDNTQEQVKAHAKHARFKDYTYQSQMLEHLKMQLDVIEIKSPLDFIDATDIMLMAMKNNGKYPAWAFERLNDLHNRWCA